MNDTRVGKKEKYQQIQVFVRVRPINNREKNNKCTTIVEVPNNKEVIVHERPYDKLSKKYKFDNVFGPSSKQIEVYNIVVNPLLDQVLAGYSCTVFAYGQTGTGKTFTMEGINSDSTLHWQSDSSAGIIPRSLSHLFDKLQSLEAQEYTIRVSFLELYNEDLFDLLAPNDDGSKIRLYEDTSKKGAVIIHGLEEVTVHNKSEVYKILEKGSEKRQTAATLMNAQSSRSHVVFSITVHMKESTIDGEEVLKTGKLNLVDLAGSENVGRSGSVDKRAREAGSINQSLLTLGRVITALVERAPHIPYRESKLTRLLQESLGGRTKTSIIATVSPASINMEETLSTLDYAHRAKNITNRPEVNQKLSKKEFLKQYTEEIERLRSDLLATRERNGVYLANDNYLEMQALISQQTKEIEEKLNHIKALEKTMQDKEKIFNEIQLQNITQMKELHEVKTKLNNVSDALKSTNNRLKLVAQERNEQKYLVEKYANTEQILLHQAETLLSVADTATADSYKLHDKIARKSEVEQSFEMLGEQFRNNVCECLQGIEKDILMYKEKLKQLCSSIKYDLGVKTSNKCESIDATIHRISTNLLKQHSSDTNNLTENISKSYSYYQNWMQNEIKDSVNTIESEHELLNTISTKVAQQVDNMLANAIAKNLQIVRNTVSQKLTQALYSIKEMVDSACNYELEHYARLSRNCKDIMENIEMVRGKQEVTQKQHLFAKMMGDVFSEFNLLNKSEEEHCHTVIDKCDYIGKICNKVDDCMRNNSTTSVGVKDTLKEEIQSNLEKIKNDVILETNRNEKLVDKTIEQGILINELKSSMNRSCNVLKQYKDLIECNIKDIEPKIEADKNEVLLLINDAHKITLDTCKNHEEFMEDEKIKTSNTFEEMSKKLENQEMESCRLNDKIVEQLQGTVHEINKFFDQDIQRDVPTGSTPARREFSYPRHFVETSPHERILQRFKESRKFVESTENDVSNDDIYISSDMPIKEIANSTALCDITLVSSQLDDTFSASILNNDTLLKHTNSCNSVDSHVENITQTLDISSVSVQSHTQSKSKIYMKNENKENNDLNTDTYKKVKNIQ
ncbi:Kinesin-like protein Klp61F [Anthophora plagiata]